MPKVALIQVIYNSLKYIPKVFPTVLAQSHSDCDFYVVVAANDDGGKEYIQKHYPQVKIIDPGYNIGFSRGHNELFSSIDADFFQLINPDLVVTPTFVEEMLKPFADEKVGAVSGKILRYDFEKDEPTNFIDTTGVVIAKSGRGRDRGQHELDEGQFDRLTNIIAVSGAAAMYRKTALEDVKYLRADGRTEYFDEDFHSYWEDVDLSWRIINRAWKIRFAPDAVAYHGRAASSSKGGYKKVFSFIKHHRAIPERIRKLNYKNHLFLYIKNSPHWYWQFFTREFFYNCYVLILETSTLKVLPQFFRKLPTMWRKRKYIQRHRKISVDQMEKLFQ
ncbi:MAG TPA: glycosyltransferase family 2 protein [Candidatus Doudnabacteria bacterium]|nr:glycosyltransferase family 2 protein [Candidatus Doudnabacteria bacterium]